MKAAIIPGFGGPGVFTMAERPDPAPESGQLLVRVKAAGINFADIIARMGMYPDAPELPMLIGYEVAGDIEKVGEGVEGFEAGQRVFSLTMFGGYAEMAAVPAEWARPIPDGMSYEKAAAIPVNYLTAYHSLVYMGSLKPHETVLVHAAAGGVGTASIQIANAIGAGVIGTASPSKFDYIREMGVEHIINYREQDFEKEVKRITEGRGVDIVMDSLGGRQLMKSYRCLAPGGRLVTFGMSTVVTGPKRNLLKAAREVLAVKKFHPMKLFNDNKAVIGVNLKRMEKRPDILSRQTDELIKLIESGHIHPVVDKTFPLESAGEAHQYIQDRKNKGKVILTV